MLVTYTFILMVSGSHFGEVHFINFYFTGHPFISMVCLIPEAL